jgi:putative Mn2+ efflux pump MntP
MNKKYIAEMLNAIMIVIGAGFMYLSGVLTANQEIFGSFIFLIVGLLLLVFHFEVTEDMKNKRECHPEPTRLTDVGKE